MDYQYISHIECPADLKKVPREELSKVAEECRDYLISVVSKVGGHLASSLGAAELTVALHYVFDAPRDKIVWDVGHQAYVHKILTGRRDRFPTIRQRPSGTNPYRIPTRTTTSAATCSDGSAHPVQPVLSSATG